MQSDEARGGERHLSESSAATPSTAMPVILTVMLSARALATRAALRSVDVSVEAAVAPSASAWDSGSLPALRCPTLQGG